MSIPHADVAPIGNVALMQRIWGPIEREESDDLRPFFDALADDVVLRTSVGELRGKKAVVAYFSTPSTVLEFNAFNEPLWYLGEGDRVVIAGQETFKDLTTGTTHQAEWVWLVDFNNGLVSRIVHVQDLAPVAEAVREALAKAQAEGSPEGSGSS